LTPLSNPQKIPAANITCSTVTYIQNWKVIDKYMIVLVVGGVVSAFVQIFRFFLVDAGMIMGRIVRKENPKPKPHCSHATWKKGKLVHCNPHTLVFLDCRGLRYIQLICMPRERVKENCPYLQVTSHLHTPKPQEQLWN
jgi:hypothetical protein